MIDLHIFPQYHALIFQIKLCMGTHGSFYQLFLLFFLSKETNITTTVHNFRTCPTSKRKRLKGSESHRSRSSSSEGHQWGVSLAPQFCVWVVRFISGGSECILDKGFPIAITFQSASFCRIVQIEKPFSDYLLRVAPPAAQWRIPV